MEKTIVVFRKFKDGGDVVALFPAEINYPDRSCESYQHVGQHGAADYNHCIAATVPTSDVEHRALRQELENIGYKLDVRKRYIRSRKGA